MSALISKLHETTKRLQYLTVWRPNERDPYVELDRWRTDAHTTIEQIYNKKRQQIDLLIEKHEREFMRQITRQRALLNSIRKRLLPPPPPHKEVNTLIRTQNETSILTDLNKVENEINTKLGRSEILIETIPINLEDSVMVGLKTYLSTGPSIYFKEMSTDHQSKKPTRRSADEAAHAFDNWLKVKKKDDAVVQKELQTARQNTQHQQESRFTRVLASEKAYEKWVNKKVVDGAFIKKRLSTNDCDIKQETNET